MTRRIRVPKNPGKPFLQSLDELTFSKPRQVVRMAEKAVDRIDPYLIPRLLGVYGSALRRLVRLPEAQGALTAAIRQAQELGDLKLKASLVQRLAYVPGERGDHHDALILSIRAANLFDLCEDVCGYGRCLVDQGLWRFHLGLFEESMASNRRALDILPVSERRHRYSALVGQAYNLQRLGDPDRALRYIRSSSEIASGLGTALLASFLVVNGRILEDLQRPLEACRAYAEAAETFFEAEILLDCALAGAHQVRLLGELGLHDEACDIAKNMARLIGKIDSPPAVGLLTELIRQAVAGRVHSASAICTKLEGIQNTPST